MSKLISVADDVYEKLTALKAQQSYSKVLRPLLEQKSNKEAILACVGKGGINKEAMKELHKEWKKWSDRYA